MNSIPDFLLSIDTSTEVCSVSLHTQHAIVKEQSNVPQGHAKYLLPMVESVLAKANLDKKDLNLVVVSSGPGSFTGIRIGISIAQGLAFGIGCPVLTLPSLVLMALGKSGSEGKLIVPALDARMNEIYWAAYLNNQGTLEEVVAPCKSAADTLNDWVQSYSNSNTHIKLCALGHGWSVPNVDHSWFEKIEPEFSPFSDFIHSLFFSGRNLDELNNLFNRLNIKYYTDLASIEPTYLRNEVSWEKRALKRKPKT